MQGTVHTTVQKSEAAKKARYLQVAPRCVQLEGAGSSAMALTQQQKLEAWQAKKAAEKAAKDKVRPVPPCVRPRACARTDLARSPPVRWLVESPLGFCLCR